MVSHVKPTVHLFFVSFCSVPIFSFTVSPFHQVGVRPKTSPGTQRAVELAVRASDGCFTNPISGILSDFQNESHFYFSPSVICQFHWKLKCHQLLPSGASSGTSAACFRRRVASCVAWSLSAGTRMKLD